MRAVQRERNFARRLRLCRVSPPTPPEKSGAPHWSDPVQPLAPDIATRRLLFPWRENVRLLRKNVRWLRPIYSGAAMPLRNELAAPAVVRWSVKTSCKARQLSALHGIRQDGQTANRNNLPRVSAHFVE